AARSNSSPLSLTNNLVAGLVPRLSGSAKSVAAERFATTTGNPVPGLVPGTHVFFAQVETASRRGWPGQARPRGSFGVQIARELPANWLFQLNRTAGLVPATHALLSTAAFSRRGCPGQARARELGRGDSP